MREFSKLAKERTQGRIAVDVYTDVQLGDMQRLLTGMQLGTIDMAYFDVTVAVFLKGSERLRVALAPYLFDSRAKASEVLNSDLFKQVYEEMAAKTGVRVFAVYGERSPRAVQTTKGPIMKPSDFAGMRLRVPGIDIYKRTFETLNVKVTPLGMADIYNVLSRGIVEGQARKINSAGAREHHEACARRGG
jgi:TRAP-type transport system periplasmic protein